MSKQSIFRMNFSSNELSENAKRSVYGGSVKTCDEYCDDVIDDTGCTTWDNDICNPESECDTNCE